MKRKRVPRRPSRPAAGAAREPNSCVRSSSPLALAASFLSSPAGFGLSWLVPSGDSYNKEGCGLDPSGLCAPSAEAAPLDAGCGADPYGRCDAVEVATGGLDVDRIKMERKARSGFTQSSRLQSTLFRGSRCTGG